MNSISPQALDLVSGKVTLVSGPDAGQGEGLRRLLRGAVRWRWLLLGGIVAGAVVGAAVTVLSTRQYASTVRLQISRETAQVVNLGAISRDVSIGDQEFYQTQYGLLRAKALAERVARDLGVVDDPTFFRMFGRADAYGEAGGAGRTARNAAAGDILLSRVEIAPVHGSSLVDVEARTPSPPLSQKIARTWAQDFIASNLDRRLETSSYASRFLEARLDQLRGKLETSERKAMEYAAKEGIIDLPAPGSNGNGKPSSADLVQGRSLLTDDLAALNTERETATADLIQATSQLAAAGSQPDASLDALGYRTIGVLREERADAASDYARLVAQSGPDDASSKAARAKLDALDASIRSEEKRVHASLQQTYQSALTRQQALTKRVDDLKAALADLRQRSIQYNLYQRDAATNRELYDALLQRYKEIGVAGSAETNNVAVVDDARLPDRPSSPRLSLNLLLFTLAGAAIAMMAAAVLEQLRPSPPAPAEAQRTP